MSFRENLLKKIEIQELAGQVAASLAPGAPEVRLDKQAMRRLLEMSGFVPQPVRDLELFVKEAPGGPPLVLVLDNELPVYRTSVEDVALRKSPFIKEMASIRNIVKILRDSDVKVSRGLDSLQTVVDDCLGRLDLTCTPEDVAAIAYDGAASLESRYPQGVLENLRLMAELAGFEPAPRPFASPHHVIWGRLQPETAGGPALGPFCFYDRVHGRLGLEETSPAAGDPQALAHYRQILDGRKTPTVEGAQVFFRLKEQIVAGLDAPPGESR